jgi:hypothetical protein
MEEFTIGAPQLNLNPKPTTEAELRKTLSVLTSIPWKTVCPWTWNIKYYFTGKSKSGKKKGRYWKRLGNVYLLVVAALEMIGQKAPP